MADKNTGTSLCHCSAKNTVHVHCSCQECDGKAVNYRTQQLHLVRYGPSRKRIRQDAAQLDDVPSLYDSDSIQGKLKYAYRGSYKLTIVR